MGTLASDDRVPAGTRAGWLVLAPHGDSDLEPLGVAQRAVRQCQIHVVDNRPRDRTGQTAEQLSHQRRRCSPGRSVGAVTPRPLSHHFSPTDVAEAERQSVNHLPAVQLADLVHPRTRGATADRAGETQPALLRAISAKGARERSPKAADNGISHARILCQAVPPPRKATL